MNTVVKFYRMLEGGYKIGAGEETTKVLDETCTYLMTAIDSWLVNAATMPFLQQVLVPLAIRLRTHKIQPISSVGGFYEACLGEVHKQLIPTKPRSIPNDWKHKPRTCPYQVPQLRGPCEDCKRLNVFLASRDARTWSFPAGQARRRHVSNILPDDLFTQTTQQTKPQTLVVTKKETEYNRMVGSYQRAVQAVRDMLEPLQSPYLQELLGEEKYFELVKLEEPPPRVDGAAEAQTDSESNRRLTATSGNAAGLKRAADDDADQSEAKRPRVRS